MKPGQDSHSILVVSNALGTWKTAIGALSGLGYRLETAEGGVLALSRLDHKKPDLLIIDNSLKDLNAPEVIRIVRYAYTKSKLPVILVIHGRYGGHHRAVDSSEVNAVVLKPDFETLKKRVITLLDQTRKPSRPRAEQKQSPWSHVEKLLEINKRLKHELEHSKRVASKLRQDAKQQQAPGTAQNLNQRSAESHRDELTGLIQRSELEFRLTRTLTSVQQAGGEHTLLFLKPKNIKGYTRGSNKPDEIDLVRQAAQVLQSHARKRDTVAYLGDTEFAILMEHCSVNQARRLLNTLREAIQAQTFSYYGKKIHVESYIAVVPIRKQHAECNAIISEARQTAFRSHHQASKQLNERCRQKPVTNLARTRATQVLENAIDQGRLQLYYQPIESLRGDANEIRYELFVRMQDQYGRFIRPGAFLPATERFDLIALLDRWVVSTALAWLARHTEHLHRLALCCINLSGKSLSDAQQHEFIAHQFRETRVPAHKICFEVTETVAITNVNDAGQWMARLRNLGCSFALDDFGSGLSSLAYLKNLPADFVKIDGRFIKNLSCSSIDLAMVKSINDMAHVIGKQTIAEMVEEEKVLGTLRDIGIDFAQGYAVGRPLPLKALILDSVTTSTAR